MRSSLKWTGDGSTRLRTFRLLGLFIALAQGPEAAWSEPKEREAESELLDRRPRTIEGFHLAVGLSSAILNMRSQSNFQYNYLGGAFFSAANYHFGRLALGIKSSAYLGLDSYNQKDIRSVPALRQTDYVQYVSFSPHASYHFANGLFVSIGYAGSQTGINRSAEYLEAYGRVKPKVTLQGKGIDATVGYVLPHEAGENPSFIFFDYQNTVPGSERLVDVTDETDVVTIDRSIESEIIRVRFYCISYGTYLF